MDPKFVVLADAIRKPQIYALPWGDEIDVDHGITMTARAPIGHEWVGDRQYPDVDAVAY